MIAINGDERSAVIGVSYWRNVRGETYRVDVDRRGERVSLELPLPLVPVRQIDLTYAVYGLAFFACGAALTLARPRDSHVRLIAACLMLAATGFLSATVAAGRGFLVGWEPLAYFVIAAGSSLVFPMTYHVFSRFPTGINPGPLWRALQWLLYALFLLVFWPAWALNYLGIDVGPSATRFRCSQLAARS